MDTMRPAGVRNAIETGNVRLLRELLAADPRLADEHIVWGDRDHLRTHPLHYISDMLFNGTLDRQQERDVAVAMVDALLAAGADVNHLAADGSSGDPRCETALNGAASLSAQYVGIRLLDAGARTDIRNLGGETALHWAAHEGLERLVAHILRVEAPSCASLHVRDARWNATPLDWAMHGWLGARPGHPGAYPQVVVALVRAGAPGVDEWLSSPRIDGHPQKVAALRGAS